MAVSFSTKNVRFITYPFSKVSKISVGASSKSARSVCSGRNARIPRKNIVVNVFPGLSVAVLPEFLDLELLVKFYFRVLIYMSSILRIHSPWYMYCFTTLDRDF